MRGWPPGGAPGSQLYLGERTWSEEGSGQVRDAEARGSLQPWVPRREKTGVSEPRGLACRGQKPLEMGSLSGAQSGQAAGWIRGAQGAREFAPAVNP